MYILEIGSTIGRPTEAAYKTVEGARRDAEAFARQPFVTKVRILDSKANDEVVYEAKGKAGTAA